MNEVFQIKTHLHFGAKIYISCYNNYSKFYMFSNGISFKTIISIAESQGPFDPSMCLFIITPVMKFQSETFLEKILNNRYNQENEGIQYDQKKTKVFIDQFQFELKQNNKLKDQQVNYPIKYNQNFMLQHIFSSKYLCFTKNHESNQYSLQLSQLPTTSCIFSLKACFNYQKDINTYVPFNSAAFLNVKIQEGLQVHQMNLNFIPNSLFDSWMFSEESQDKIKIQLYQTGEEIQYKNICFGDSVWIFHLQSGSFVKVIDDDLNPNSIILSKIKYTLGYTNQVKPSAEQDYNEEIKSKIIVQKAQNQMSAQKFGLWKVLPVNNKQSTNQANEKGRFVGGRVKFDQQIRFFNMKYKSYLGVRKIKRGRNKIQFGYAMELTEEDSTIFKIKSLSSNSAYVTTEDLFLIQNVSFNTYLTLSAKFPINQTQAPLSPSQTYKKQDNFKFTKIDFLQQWQNNNILSIMPFINEGIRALQASKEGYTTHRDQVMLRLMCQNLIELLTFSYDLTQGFEASQSKLGKMTYNHFSVQKLLREQNVLDKLIEVLKSIDPDFLIENVNDKKKMPLKLMGVINIVKKFGIGAKDGADRSQTKIQRKLLLKIVDTSLKILRNCCKSNTQNSLIIFKNSNVIFKYLSLGTYAQNFVIDSFNSTILQRIGTDQFKTIIDQYIKVYQKTKIQSERIFDLLTKLLKDQQKSIGKNQLQIYRLFFYKDNPLLIPIEQANNRFYINKIQLNQFCQQFPQTGYILGCQIKFCAQLTSDRNYVCSKTIKKMFPLNTLLNYLIHNPVENKKVKQSLIWIIIHSYLNQRPRFKQASPLVFSIPYAEDEEAVKRPGQFGMQMEIMRKEGFSAGLIDDILSCIHQGDSMTERDLGDLKNFVTSKIKQMLQDSQNIRQFYSSTMETYVVCLKYLVELSVFKKDEFQQIQRIIEKISKKVDQALILKNDNTEKLESTNFRQLLLEMVQKNVIKKFNFSAKYDGHQDEVKFDNICSIFVNYSFYQNILLQEKDLKKRKQADSVTKVILQLIALYEQIQRTQKIKMFVEQLIKPGNMKIRSRDKSGLIKEIIVQNILRYPQEQKTDIFKLLVLLFYNSNTYSINNISLQYLLGQVFSDRIAIQKLTKIQFNVDQRQKEDYLQIQRAYKNVKLLIQTSQIWLNVHEAIKSKTSKYDSVILLFINKTKQLLKVVMPQMDEDASKILFCSKYAKSIIPEKQQILANIGIHHDYVDFIREFKPLMKKMKAKPTNGFNQLLIPLFKCCFLFMFVFIYDSPENKTEVHELVKQSYNRDYYNEVGNLELGETIFLIEYLKNNYEQCIDFYNKNPQVFQKYHKYSAAHSKLLLTTLSFYNEPILVNLRKFYISIFDFTSFKTFLWFKPNENELNLNLEIYGKELDKQPYLYHIHAIEAILKVVTYIEQSRNTIRQHIKKSLSQQYLYGLLSLDDFYTKESSNHPILKVIIHFKSKVLKLIQFAYFSEQQKNDELFFNQLKRQNGILMNMLNQSAARLENEDFRKIVLVRDLKEDGTFQNENIRQLYENLLYCNKKGEHILQVYLNSVDKFCMAYKNLHIKSSVSNTQKLIQACDDIHKKIVFVYDILHKNIKNFSEGDSAVQKYPIPYQWLFTMSSSYRDQQSLSHKKYFSSFLIQTMFSQAIYLKFRQNQKKAIKNFLGTLNKVQLKQFLFLRKLSQFIEDAFEKLSNHPTPEMYECLKLLIYFMTLLIQCQSKQKVNELRAQIGKSELIFPILNFFETCVFDKLNKQMFLICLEFFNELIGEQGNRTIQTIFNQYFTNKADSIEFFMKIKQLFYAINFEDRVNYKCKKIYDGVEQLSKDSKLQKKSEFIILNFLIRLCKGNFRDNQIFLSSLSNVSNFNIMSGIWQILKNQSQKYKKNLINAENYHLITQCFSTIRQLVEGPCVQNQNEFLKRDFFLTVLDYFQFEALEVDLTLENVLEERLKQIQKISLSFTEKLRIYLNRDKITSHWMPSQVKYRCISLICSLLSQNVNQQSKSQLYTISPSIIIKQLDRVYHRYTQLGLSYTYENLEVKQQTEVVLPLGFKLYELLQYYPADKLPDHSPGLDFFRHNSRIVEVLHQKLCVVVFPHIPDEISDAYKTKFLQQVDRSSVNSKLRGLQDAQVQNKQSDYPYGYLLSLIVVIITILDIILYNDVSLINVQFFNFYPILRLYGTSSQQQVTEQVLISVLVLLCLFLSLVFLILEVRGAIYFREHMVQIYHADFSKFDKVKMVVKFIWNNLTYFHYFITLMLCILTIFNPFFDAVLLMVELYRRSETFSAIVDAIKATLDQLLVVLLFTLVCTYVLTTFMYFYFAQTKYPSQCANLYHCFVFSLDQGFRSDSGIAGYADGSSVPILQQYLVENIQNVLVNFIYLFIIKVIIEQIIGAIMVDKFAQLRQNKQKLQQDEDSFCFICGLQRNLLDRQEDGFEYHKLQYHNIWNYFQFLIYLRKSKLSNLSGIQLFVYDQQKNNKLNWFPISRSYHLQMKIQEANEKQEDEENQLQKMNKLLDLEVSQLRDEISLIWNLLNVKLTRQKNMKQ